MIREEQAMTISITQTDTSPDALDVQLACFRALTPQERLQKMVASSRRGRDLAMAAIHAAEPRLSDQEVRLRYLALAYGEELATEVRQWLGARGR
jgi:hypothetical protein